MLPLSQLLLLLLLLLLLPGLPLHTSCRSFARHSLPSQSGLVARPRNAAILCHHEAWRQQLVSWSVGIKQQSLEGNGAMFVVVVSHSLIRIDHQRQAKFLPATVRGLRQARALRRPPATCSSPLCKSAQITVCPLEHRPLLGPLMLICHDRPSVSRPSHSLPQ